MKIALPTSFFLTVLSQRGLAKAQPPQDCSGTSKQFKAPSKGSCLSNWKTGNTWKVYPDDFGNVLNEVEIYTCEASQKRIIISNGIPDHNVKLMNPNKPCELYWAVSMPLEPTMENSKTEIPIRGAIAMALNGVPAYGPQEVAGENAVEPDSNSQIQDAQFWYGHADGQKGWHFHNPLMGEEEADSSTLLGYAFDGFPIYGPLSDSDSSELDECNGRTENGKYMYHVMDPNNVQETDDYCNGNSPANRWNYILGCYSGSIQNTVVTSSTNFNIPSDCTNKSLSPTKKPVTKKPVKSPTKKPVKSPTKKPVLSLSPTKKPVTKKPVKSPTKKPVLSLSPTKKPVTKKPVKSPTKKPVLSPTVPGECTQEAGDKWFFKMNNNKNKPVLKTCDYLEGLSNKKRKKLCGKKVKIEGNYDPPQYVCEKSCKSCDSCYENTLAKFVYKIKNDEPVLKNCKWLSERGEMISQFCNKKLDLGGYRFPKIVCPVTCGVGDCVNMGLGRMK